MSAPLVADILRRYGACSDAIKWAGKRRDPRRAWLACPRGDHLIWIAAEIGVDPKLVVRAACDCVRPALRYALAGEDRPRVAIETAERWCEGKATIEEVRAAADAAAAAAYAADAYRAAAADAARTTSLARSADLVRERIPWSAVSAALRGAS